MAVDVQNSLYSCRCLNVQVQGQATSQGTPPGIGDGEFSALFVGQEGISIAQVQVTMRTRIDAGTIPGPSKQRTPHSTVLSCLLCSMPVYRVCQGVPVDGEVSFQAGEWMEDSILLSRSGWIEVHRDCLSGDALKRLRESSDYSPVFGVVVPANTKAPASSPSPPTSPPLTASDVAISVPDTRVYLPELPDVFPPPPFSPSHPAFVALSSTAIEESRRLRAKAEQEVAMIISRKVSDLENAEKHLREQTQALWLAFRAGLEQTQVASDVQDVQRDNARSSMTSPTAVSATVIRNFMPTRGSVSRPASAAATPPRPSALSASLATSGFHHPAARQDSPSGVAMRPSPSSQLPSPSASPSSSERAGFAKSVGIRRNMDKSLDIATSVRYVSVLEEEMQRGRPEVVPLSTVEEDEATGQVAKLAMQNSTDVPDENGNERGTGTTARASKPAAGDALPQSPPRKPLKDGDTTKKRKVKFEAEPAVVTISPGQPVDGQDAYREANPLEPEDAVFDFEDESGLNLDGATPDNTRRGKLPQEISKTPSPPRTSERPLSRRKNSLPLSFEALRPSSLPAPSHVRPGPSGSQTGTQTSPTSRRMPHSRVVSPTLPNPTESVGQVRSMARDSMLRKLAATDVPTYRQGWEQESPSWQIFAQKRGSQDPVPSGTAIAEEEDEGNERGRGDKEDIEADVSTVNEEDPSEFFAVNPPENGLPRSMPIPIGVLGSHNRDVDFETKTSLRDRPAMRVAALQNAPGMPSSLALRKASYAERDRLRAMDPGMLDFAATDTDDDTQTEEEEEGDRGRKHAQKILKARSELPAASMWRSMA